MTDGSESKGVPAWLADEGAQAWMEAHAGELRQTVAGQRLLYSSLVVSFVVGLAAHVAGYALLLSAPREPLGLLAELVQALGWSLWTGVVVVIFVQIIPEAKRHQIRQALEAYEALQREKARGKVGSDG
jgi:hypothetical protein